MNGTNTKPAVTKKPRPKLTTGEAQNHICLLCGYPYDTADHQRLALYCSHAFCKSCLAGLCSGRKKLKCPSCREVNDVPKPKVLQSKAACDKPPASDEPSARHEADADEEGVCEKHLRQPRLFYCQTCSVSICMHCTVIDHDKAHGHTIIDIAQAKSLHSSKLQSDLNVLDGQLEQSQNLLNQLNLQAQCLEATNSMTNQRIEETFKQLHDHLSKRKEHLLSKVNHMYTKSKANIKSNAMEIKTVANKLSSEKHKIETSINSLDKSFRSGPLASTLEDLCSETAALKVENHMGCLDFNFKHNLEEYLLVQKDIGAVSCASPLPTTIEFDTPNMCCGIPTVFKLMLLSAKSQPITGVVLAVKVEHLAHHVQPINITGNSDSKTGSYSFSFHPMVSGDYRATPIFCDLPLMQFATNFMVSPNNPVQIIGVNDLKKPSSIAVSQAGYIYVADTGNKRIRVYEEDGVPSFAIQLGPATTYDVAINKALQVLYYTRVTTNEHGQTITHTVQTTDLNGESLTHFTNHEMHRAMFLAVNSKGQLVVSDSGQNCVYIYSKEGIPIKKFGTFGDHPGQFNFPTAVAIGVEDLIYVSDTKNDRIQVFDHAGQHRKTYGPNLGREIILHTPRGVAVSKHKILIADSIGRIVIIDNKAKALWIIESQEAPIPEPYNLAIAGKFAYVADFKNNCIKKFKIK